jgi:hypothetical protein
MPLLPPPLLLSPSPFTSPFIALAITVALLLLGCVVIGIFYQVQKQLLLENYRLDWGQGTANVSKFSQSNVNRLAGAARAAKE